MGPEDGGSSVKKLMGKEGMQEGKETCVHSKPRDGLFNELFDDPGFRWCPVLAGSIPRRDKEIQSEHQLKQKITFAFQHQLFFV